jgi:succinate-semialdehyde dehydrogenase/glutarate-semialdehyde dehydrogenase
MSDYAVINPATGETLKTYPTITDDELQAAIAGGSHQARAQGRRAAFRAA